MAELKLYKCVLGMVQTNVYFIKNADTNEMIIVDPAEDAQTIFECVEDAGGIPVAIYLTHGHYDHILAAEEVREKYKIPIIVEEEDEKVLEDPKLNMSGFYGINCSLKADEIVKDGDELNYAGLPCTVMHTPGHTWGSCCFYFPESKLLISGDTLFQFSYGRTDFATSNAADMAKSIKRILELPEDVTACPGHMGYTTIEAERKYNPLA